MRPVVLIGNGCRGVDWRKIVAPNAPILTSWQAIDIVPSDHPLNFGRPGVYGQRCANRILFEAGEVLSIGCRMSVWTVGYDFKHPHIFQVEIDERERKDGAEFIHSTAAEFFEDRGPHYFRLIQSETEWISKCEGWRNEFPWIESAHSDRDGYINSYRFMQAINKELKPDSVIVVDVGGFACSAQQV